MGWRTKKLHRKYRFFRKLTAGDRRIEHKRRRAALKRQPEGEETKTERRHERWDKWNWD